MDQTTGAAPVHTFRDDALGEYDATGTAEAIAAGKVSSHEVVEAAIARAESVRAVLDPIAYEGFDRALRESHAPHSGVFAGVPTILKDNVDAAGQPTGQGSVAFTPHPAARDSAFVTQFRSTGAISLGKSRLPEFGFNATTEYMVDPPVRNPWNTEHSPGASSGGSAALVAAGVVPFAHANDGGGTIRIPAAACGLVGLTPTRGRLVADQMDRTMPIRIVAQGVVTRSVRDTARFFAEAEKAYRNPKLPPVRLVSGPASTRLRVGVVTDSVTGLPTDDETRAAVAATADLLDGLGHHVEDAALPVGKEFEHDFSLYWALLAFAITKSGRKLGADFDPARTDTLTRGLDAMYRKNYTKTPQVLYRLARTRQRYADMFARYDVVLSPVVANTTPRLGHLSPAQDFEQLFSRLVAHVSFTPLNNAAGGPGISLPLHQDSRGLPLAAHFSAAYGDERTLLELAFEREQAVGWRRIQDAAVAR